MAERETGTIKWYNRGRGYGFITRPGGDDLFVHFSALGDPDTAPTPGQSVEYEIDESGPGPMASEVQLL